MREQLARGQRGWMSVWMAAIFPALIIIAGIAVDFAGHAKVANHARAVAGEAARAGGQALEAVEGDPVLTRQATAAAERYLSASGVTGSVQVVGTELQVTTHATYETVFLSVIGINQMPVQGSGSADLFTVVVGEER